MPDTSGRRTRRWVRDNRPGLAVLAVLLLGIVVLGAFALRRTNAAEPRPEATSGSFGTLSQSHDAVAAFLGDSYTGGSNEGGNAGASWASLVAQKHRWSVRMLAVGGSGYTIAGPLDGANVFGDRVTKLIATHPDIVFVEGGHNDVVTAPAKVKAAAATVLQQIRSGLPVAKIIVIGPIWPNNNYPPSLLTIRNGIKAAAAAVNAYWIDPIAENWFAGASAKLIGADGTHPTDAGHIHIAQLVERDLTRLKVRV